MICHSEAGKQGGVNVSCLWLGLYFIHHLIRRGPPPWGGQSALLRAPVQMLLSGKNTPTDPPRVMFSPGPRGQSGGHTALIHELSKGCTPPPRSSHSFGSSPRPGWGGISPFDFSLTPTGAVSTATRSLSLTLTHTHGTLHVRQDQESPGTSCERPMHVPSCVSVSSTSVSKLFNHLPRHQFTWRGSGLGDKPR